MCVCEQTASYHAIKSYEHEFFDAGDIPMFAANCPTKRAAYVTDMILESWSHAPGLQAACVCVCVI